MLCDDCLFEMGIDEYEKQSPNQYRPERYRCSRCQEIVSSRFSCYYFEDKILEIIDKKTNIARGKRYVRELQG